MNEEGEEEWATEDEAVDAELPAEGRVDTGAGETLAPLSGPAAPLPATPAGEPAMPECKLPAQGDDLPVALQRMGTSVFVAFREGCMCSLKHMLWVDATCNEVILSPRLLRPSPPPHRSEQTLLRHQPRSFLFPQAGSELSCRLSMLSARTLRCFSRPKGS